MGSEMAMNESLNSYKDDSVDALLHLLKGGLRQLFVNCKQHNVAAPLYGRNIYSPPEGQGDEGDPAFDFDFGFSPLGALADYLHKHDPRTVAAEKARRQEVQRQLQQRGEHAKLRDQVQWSLPDALAIRQCGVLGPFVSFNRIGGVDVWCRALYAGTVLVQVSPTSSFEELIFANEYTIDQPDGQSLEVSIDSLSPATTYFVRAFIRNDELELDHLQSTSMFTTSGRQRPDPSLSIRVVAASSLGSSLEAVNSPSQVESHVHKAPSVVCVLGNPFSMTQGFETHIRNSNFRSSGLIRQSALCVAWADDSPGAGIEFKAEEVIFKQYQRDQHRFERKKAKHPAKIVSDNLQPPTLLLPPVSTALQEAVDFLPLPQLSNDTLRTVNKHTHLGPTADLFTVDMRAGYVGKEQLKWLYGALRKSNAIWKFIACRHAITLDSSEPHDELDTARSNPGGEADDDAEKAAQTSEKKITSLPSLMHHLQSHYADRYAAEDGLSQMSPPTGIVVLSSTSHEWCVSICDPLQLGWPVCLEICVNDTSKSLEQRGAGDQLKAAEGVTIIHRSTGAQQACSAMIQFEQDGSLSLQILSVDDSRASTERVELSCSIPCWPR